MEMVNRKVTFRMYPTKSQGSQLHFLFHEHRRLYNRLLEERKSAWETEKKSLAFVDKFMD